jgi:hypothetical protein
MPMRLSIEARGEYLRFEATGERVRGETVPEALRMWSLVAEECRATGLDRVLGINRVTGKPVALDIFQISSRLPAILAGAVRKVAFVIVGDQELVRASLFAENVAVNRGVNGRVFEDETRALAWLLER